jgi:two-component sensor histidine kinase
MVGPRKANAMVDPTDPEPLPTIDTAAGIVPAASENETVEMVLTPNTDAAALSVDLGSLGIPVRVYGPRRQISWQSHSFAQLLSLEGTRSNVASAIARAERYLTASARRANPRPIDDIEFSVIGPTGLPHWFAMRVTTVETAVGEASAIYAVDIQRYQARAERQMLLRQEVAHRLRNLLALVQATAHDVFSGPDATPAAHRFRDRLNTLAAVAGAESTDRDSTPVSVVVDRVLRRFKEPDDERIKASGNALDLDTRSAQTLALVLHELATNSVKHGALGYRMGHVTVRWCLVHKDGRPLLHLDWRESVPALVHWSGQDGFGMRFVKRLIAAQPGSTILFRVPLTGLVCNLELALP